MIRWIVAVIVLLLAACAGQQCRPVEKEVYRKTEASDDLKQPLNLQRPIWVWPDAAEAASCLTAVGEDQIRDTDFALLERVCAWEAWAGLPVYPYCERIHNGRSDQKN